MTTAGRPFRLAPLLALLHPGRLAWPAAIALVIGLILGWSSFLVLGLPRWTITAIVLLVLLPVGILKWRDDLRRHGFTVMMLSILLITQGVHTIEHLMQVAQYYIQLLPARQANGLLSPANAEWVHFVWNWSVLLVVLVLLRGGVRNPPAIALLVVAGAHAIEHTYTFVRYLQVLSELRELEVLRVTAQGLPGIIGRDGWLARSPLTQGTFLCTLPGITTAMRLDVHFWWNVIETTLLLGAATWFLGGHPPTLAPSWWRARGWWGARRARQGTGASVG
jgi:hypothetical protein